MTDENLIQAAPQPAQPNPPTDNIWQSRPVPQDGSTQPNATQSEKIGIQPLGPP